MCFAMNKNQKGQGLVEYLVLTSLIAVTSIVVVAVVGKNLREQYANISAALRREKPVPVTPVDSDLLEERGMDDFHHGWQRKGE
jgi:Flp pilus assembly pilin Flp